MHGGSMKTKHINYAMVADEIQKLSNAGEKITVRNVLARTGGSFAEISSYIKQWHSERLAIKEYAISDTLAGAVVAEMKITVENALKNRELELAAANELIDEMCGYNAQLKQILADYEQIKQQLTSKQEEITFLGRSLSDVSKERDQLMSNNAIIVKRLEYAESALVNVENKSKELEKECQQILRDKAVLQSTNEQLQTHMDKLMEKLGNKIS